MKIKVLFFILIIVSAAALNAQGCMEASSDEGVNVVGYMQTQIEYQSGEDEDITSFTFNRARMGLVGNIPYDFSYYIMFEFSPNKTGAPYLLDGFITYSRLTPYMNLSLGQFKSPFSLELNTPCQGLHTVKRSEVVNELASPDRDRGIMFTGAYKEMLRYSLAFTNGPGRDDFENNENKVFAGRLVFSPLEFLSVGAGYKSGTSPALDTSVEDEDELTRMAFDLHAEYNDFIVQAEYITAEDKGSYTTGGG